MAGLFGSVVSRQICVLFAALIVANLGAWLWAVAAFAHHPVLLGTALLAYSLGLRHALDADHIAAIDNVTRKLMQEGERPLSAGLFFSLGHSTVVVLASLMVAAGARLFLTGAFAYRSAGSMIGTAVSATFLFTIAILNLNILWRIGRTFRRVGKGGVLEDGDALLPVRGLLARLLHPLFRWIGASWQMYPLGFLFGLGFDTATEIGLLGISASEAARGLDPWSVLVFPALFASAMALIDAADSVLMVGVYGWAFVKPVRKLYYNLTMTAVSAVIAFLVGGVQALGLIAEKLALSGGLWDLVLVLNQKFGILGYVIVGLFAASWMLSILIYRLKGYDRLDRLDAMSEAA